MSHPFSSRQHARHGLRHAPRVSAFSAHRIRQLQRRHERAALRERARVVASLLAASRALPSDPDAAALLLDGALAQFLDLWAQQVHLPRADRRQALAALDAQAPAVAWRVRLALQAHLPEARLAHCWALLDLLTIPTTRRNRYPSKAPLSRKAGERLGVDAPSPIHPTLRADHHHERTNGASHVS
ncbi:MAG TPA: hypothetical protein VF739_14045 [Ktedonobacterales bacterium]